MSEIATPSFHAGHEISKAQARLIDEQRATIARLRAALELSIGVAESWVHDQLGGTSHLEDGLLELAPARAELEASK